MYKHTFILVILFFVSASFASAQDKIEKFCKVNIGPNPKSLSTKLYTKISFGEHNELFALKDTSVFQKLRYVNQLTSEIDVLNFMSASGWTLVKIHAPNIFKILYFKKTFDRSELTE